MGIDWQQVVKQLRGFAFFGCFAWIFGPQVPVGWRITLVVLAVGSAVASSYADGTLAARLIKTATVPPQRTPA